MKQLYISFTRPKYLLCVAINKSKLPKAYFKKLDRLVGDCRFNTLISSKKNRQTEICLFLNTLSEV